RIDFQQEVGCIVIAQGILSTVHYPDATGYDTLLTHYKIHITNTSDHAEPSFLNLEEHITTPSDPNRVNEPFSNTLPGSLFPADFFTVTKTYYCVVFHDPTNTKRDEGHHLGSTLVTDPNE
ncbi:3047_t:CDS:1, partial [Ambispora gerdemannii]